VADILSPRAVRASVRALQSIGVSDVLGMDQLNSESGVLSTTPGLVFQGLRLAIVGLERVDGPARGAFVRMVSDLAREALCLCVLPSIDEDVWPLEGSELQVGAAGVIPIYRSDMDALALGLSDLVTLIDYKLFRRFILDKPDQATRYAQNLFADYQESARGSASRSTFQPLDQVTKELAEDPEGWVPHPLEERITRVLDHGRGCMLVGNSSSGKSVLCFRVGMQQLLSGNAVCYVNLGSTSTQPLRVVSTLLADSGTQPRPDLLIVDDLQSNPSAARYVLACGNLFRRATTARQVPILTSAWPDFAKEAAVWHERCFQVAVQPSQVRDVIIRRDGAGVSGEILAGLVRRLGDDLVLLRLSVKQAAIAGVSPPLRKVAEELWKDRTAGLAIAVGVAERVALVAGTLGRYDIPSPAKFLGHEARVEDRDLDELTRKGLLRRQGGMFSMGHRSLCALISDWLGRKDCWKLLSELGGPRKADVVVLDYLRSLKSGLTVDSLRALQARAGLKDRPRLNDRAAAVLSIWQAFDAIVEKIESQQQKDSTWNETPSSAMFAILALSEVGKPELARDSLRFLREHWSISNGQIVVTTAGLNTRADFAGIQIEMSKEDARQPSTAVISQPAATLDVERFHQTWFLGLVLCAEAAAREPGVDLDRLVSLVEASQLKESGAFYPARVPWCTARVLLGLAACGRTVHNSACVEQAANWLLRPISNGGPLRDGAWDGGTGIWNSRLETTAMVLLALSAVGFDVSDKRLGKAKDFLLSARQDWTKAGMELPGVIAIQAYLETGGAWEDVVHEAQSLSSWARGKALWEGATLTQDAQLEQSCLVAQVAAHLVSIGWTAVRSDLPAFLDSLTTPEQYQDEMDMPIPILPGEKAGKDRVEDPTSLGLSAAGGDPVLKALRELQELSLSEAIVVGQYSRSDDRVRNLLKDWCMRMKRPLEQQTGTHENFLVWAAPGSGKTFLVQQLAGSLGSKINYFELNLAAMSQENYMQRLQEVTQSGKPTLCLLDEIDARADEEWPYDALFSRLDLNKEPGNPGIVFVLIGSKAEGLQGMAQKMKARFKGQDLVDRIPVDRRFEIPPPTLADRAMVLASNVISAASSRGTQVLELEKFMLYYALVNDDLRSPRQLSDLARDSVLRLSASDDRLRYDHLFEAGDSRNQVFWSTHLSAASELAGHFVRVRP